MVKMFHYLRCAIQCPLVTYAYQTLDARLVQLRDWIFHFILKFNSSKYNCKQSHASVFVSVTSASNNLISTLTYWRVYYSIQKTEIMRNSWCFEISWSVVECTVPSGAQIGRSLRFGARMKLIDSWSASIFSCLCSWSYGH